MSLIGINLVFNFFRLVTKVHLRCYLSFESNLCNCMCGSLDQF